MRKINKITNFFKNKTLQALRHINTTRDANFIGFDKYENFGDYHWKNLQNNLDYQSKIKFLEKHIQPTDRCLDIGCGDGVFIFALSTKCDSIVGIDADYDAIRLAQRNLKRAQIKNAKCLRLPISGINLKSLGVEKTFDCVYSIDVIEHLPNPEEILKIASSLVVPGGKVIIGTPLFVTAELVSPYHVQEFTQAELRELLSKFLDLEHEVVLPQVRLDGKEYANGFYFGVGTPRVP